MNLVAHRIVIAFFCTIVLGCGNQASTPLIMQPKTALHMLGQIQILKDDRQVLRRADWIAIAANNPALVDPPPRMGRNPADGKPMQLRLPPDDRAITIGGEFVGAFRWSSYEYPGPDWEDDLGVVVVECAEGHEEHVKKIALEFAETMSADFVIR
ncbi:hypothetical protein [Novipirellula caenicola]|uniref:Uncharacterized protein n=1 Tax=Novipirellula caenicola TaxID=1536901 RepID=A0ABP9VIZ0_9BACT